MPIFEKPWDIKLDKKSYDLWQFLVVMLLQTVIKKFKFNLISELFQSKTNSIKINKKLKKCVRFFNEFNALKYRISSIQVFKDILFHNFDAGQQLLDWNRRTHIKIVTSGV